MKNKLSFLVSVSILLALSTTAADFPKRKIVAFDNDFVNESAKEELLSRHGGIKIKNLDLIEGRAVYLPDRAAAELARVKGVRYVEEDIILTALDTDDADRNRAEKSDHRIKSQSHQNTQPTEILPWGIDRIDADLVWVSNTGDLIKVAILDTGIELSHPDLQANIKGGYNAINPTKSANDDNGHGTHVAGIVAAVDNTIGVVGAAPQADLYAVKVLNRNGSGWLSDIIEGLDWSIANGMQVVNMSLGTASYSQALEEAVKRVNAAGVVQVAAAGNSGPGDKTVIYPAKFAEVIAVSATDSSDSLPFWSSRGPEVDLAAPGASIYSTYKDKTYRTLSGTSMASPHVAGTVALLLNTLPGAYDLDLDWVLDPSEVQNKLEATAKDLGAAGKDNLYGAGLVDAKKAVQ